jgi:uncharacterized protein (TIGR00255 family)
MTGYGKADGLFNGKKLHAEIKSLNSKALDVSTRLAPIYRDKDIAIRKLIADRLERGKVDFNLWIEKDANTLSTPINAAAVEEYIEQIAKISADNDLPFPTQNVWEVLVKLPDTTLTTTVEELSDEEWLVAQQVVEQAIEHLIDFRRQEGAALQQKFEQKLENIAQLLAAVEPYEKARVEKIRTRLTDRLTELRGVDYDNNRLEQELIFYIEKLDISEEKQRLTQHLCYFHETLENGHGQGKKLGFIAQEMGREINTLGSKSNQAEMQNIVVKMKDELEQIKEQVLNAL